MAISFRSMLRHPSKRAELKQKEVKMSNIERNVSIYQKISKHIQGSENYKIFGCKSSKYIKSPNICIVNKANISL